MAITAHLTFQKVIIYLKLESSKGIIISEAGKLQRITDDMFADGIKIYNIDALNSNEVQRSLKETEEWSEKVTDARCEE